MADPVTQGLFRMLVERAGGVDVAASLIEARFGTGHKGTISKMCAGHIGVTVDAAVVLENFCNAYPITNRLVARQTADRADGGCICDLTAQSALAAGKAHAALVLALASGGESGAAISRREAAAIAVQAGALRDYAARIVDEAERLVDPAPEMLRFRRSAS